MSKKIFSVLLLFVIYCCFFSPFSSYGQSVKKRGHTCTADLDQDNFSSSLPASFLPGVEKKSYLALGVGGLAPNFPSFENSSWRYGKVLTGLAFDWLVLGASWNLDAYSAADVSFAEGKGQTITESGRKVNASVGFFAAVDAKDSPMSFGYEWHKTNNVSQDFVFVGIGKEKRRVLFFYNLAPGDRWSLGFGVSSKFK